MPPVLNGGPGPVVLDRDALLGSVGRRLGPSGWVTVDQDTIDAFAETTADRQWIHVEPERAARELPDGRTIAHGYLVLSLLPVLTQSLASVPSARLALNYGLDRVRFPAPVPAGSRLRATLVVTEAQAQGEDLRIVERVEVEREGEPRPVCVADLVVLYRF